jgi:hypothetical protein
MEDYRILPVNEAYNDQILRIMEEAPIHAKGLGIRFDKSPDVFALPRLKYSECFHLGIFSDESLKGVASLGFYNSLVEGKEETIFTLFNFYILPEARGNHLSARATRDFIPLIRERGRFGIAVTMKGNKPVESYLNHTEGSFVLPSRIIDGLCIKSIILSSPRKNQTPFTVRNAVIEDIPEITALLNMEHRQRFMGLRFTDTEILKNLKIRGLDVSDYFVAENRSGRIAGVCLAWDCHSLRRTRIVKISRALLPLLLSYRLLSGVLPMAAFPGKGGYFRELTITDYAVADRNVQIMYALLCEVYRRNLNRKYHFINFGSCMGDDLLRAADSFWHFNTVSSIAFTSLDPDKLNIPARLPYIDIAFL